MRPCAEFEASWTDNARSDAGGIGRIRRIGM